ncbi:MAG: hypothetical protein U0572_16835 [Phycisphaerales bacterium]
MKKHDQLLSIVLIESIALSWLSTFASAATSYYVDISQDNGDGSSWVSPFKYLADAFVAANSAGDVIYVARGDYRPDEASGEGISNDAATGFAIHRGVTVRGGYKGGGGFDAGSVLVNCTFANNEAALHGGAFSMSRDDAGPAPRDTALRNCILWGNTKSHCEPEELCPGGQIEIIGEGDGQVLVVDHCDVQGGEDEIIDVTPAVVQWDDDIDFDLDPLFANMAQGQLQLDYSSPCVNSGDPTYFPSDDADVDSNPANDGDPVPWDVARQE